MNWTTSERVTPTTMEHITMCFVLGTVAIELGLTSLGCLFLSEGMKVPLEEKLYWSTH